MLKAQLTGRLPSGDASKEKPGSPGVNWTTRSSLTNISSILHLRPAQNM